MKEELKEFRRLKRRCKKVVLNDFYDCIELSENELHILKTFGNAESFKDISPSIYQVADFFINNLWKKIKEEKKYNNLIGGE